MIFNIYQKITVS